MAVSFIGGRNRRTRRKHVASHWQQLFMPWWLYWISHQDKSTILFWRLIREYLCTAWALHEMDLHHVSSSLISDMFFGQVKRVKIVTRVIMIMIFNATFHSISVLFFDWRLLISPFGIVKPFWHIQLLTRRVSLVEQELPTLPVNLSSPQIFSEVNVACSLVLCVYFVDRCLSFCPFSFGHCVVCPSSIYGFWLPSANSSYVQFYSITILPFFS